MEIIKFNNPTNPMRMEGGEIINGIDSKLWIERYIDAGEFQLVGDVSYGLQDKLPRGSFITHTDTTEIMVVEDHEINYSKNEESKIKITGRSFETLATRRIMGYNKTFPIYAGSPTDGVVASNVAPAQIIFLFTEALNRASFIDTTNEIPYIVVAGYGLETYPTLPERTFPLQAYYKVALELMTANNIGVGVLRPGPWNIPGYPDDETQLVVHDGTDLTSSVIFSHEGGDIESADYFWSDRKKSTYAIVAGRWIQIKVDIDPTAQNKDRIMLFVDARDLDQDYSSPPPAGAARDAIVSDMIQRGTDALYSNKEVIINKVNVGKNNLQWKYKQDYNIGDLVTVRGDYNTSTVMRVIENVDIEDEYGKFSYPTLSIQE